MSERIVTFTFRIKDAEKAKILWGGIDSDIEEKLGVETQGMANGDLVSKYMDMEDMVICNACGKELKEIKHKKGEYL